MFGIHFEVGGVGTGQIVMKDVIFGWMYLDGFNGLAPFSLKEIYDNDRQLYRMILDRLPLHIRVEVHEAIKSFNASDDHTALRAPERFVRKNPELTNRDVAAVCCEWRNNRRNCESFNGFLFDIMTAQEPLVEARRQHGDGMPHRGWAADVLGQAMINARKKL